MVNKLDEIGAAKRECVAKQKALRSLGDLEREALLVPPPRGFAKDLEAKVASGGIGLIAEIKKASPSAGLIREDFDPAALAQAYERGGATCLSVLTDEPYFQGKNEYLTVAREACALPVLRKDFMIDVWQVAESRAIGADCILLIMAVLGDAQALELHEAATRLGMDVLIETHDAAEMERALRLPSGLIGINNRNLKTLSIDLETTEALVPRVPKDRVVVSESGLATRGDLERMRGVGVHCFLIGESLMRQADVAVATRVLMGNT
jgi:indole-3-glycerol phosphate synthase